MTPDPATAYLKALEQNLAAGNATEHTHRPALKTFLESLAPGVTATNEPKRSACGAPDYVVTADHRHGPLTIGYIEAKDVGEALAEVEKSGQLKRYREALPNLLLTDYLEFRWYVEGEPRGSARLALPARGGKLRADAASLEAAAVLLRDFLAHQPEEVARPRDLAQRLARLTHMVRDIVVTAFEQGLASQSLKDLRSAFAKTLIPDLDEPGKVGEFADMYAQTLAYGLFAARCHHSGAEPFRRLGAAAEIPKTSPFLRSLFNTLTGPDLDDEPYAGFVDDLVSLLAHTDMAAVLEDFGKRTRQEDPVVHFYETFLAAYDPQLRAARGVYYTPEPVVSYIVRSVDHLLKTRFACAQGLADSGKIEYAEEVEAGNKTEQRQQTCPRVLILDPACGTGTFLYAAADFIREAFMHQGNAGLWSGYVRENLLKRLYGFELLMAPYAVAHLKLGMQLAGLDLKPEQRRQWAYDFRSDERLGVYLTNTLAAAERRAEGLFGPLRAISDEANGAACIKRDRPIMVVMGNPPYAGHSANRSWEVREGKRVPTFIGRLLQDYYQVDGQPLGERNPKWLQDDYVKFLRWGSWRIERTGAGILAFITNHGYLDNPTFRGMRQCLMRTFDEIYILNLHGNAKKRETAPDGSKDENVFDIQQGVSICLLVKLPEARRPAQVFHADLYGTQAVKYKALCREDVSSTKWAKLRPDTPMYLFRPQGIKLRTEYERGWAMQEVMPVNVLGFQTHRDQFAVGFESTDIEARIRDLRNPTVTDERLREKYNLVDNRDWHLTEVRVRLSKMEHPMEPLIQVAYRPFDIRWCFLDEVTCDYPRKELRHHVAGKNNLCLNLVRQTRAAEWGHVAASKEPAPAVFLEIKDGSSVFPLYLYPDGRLPDSLFDYQDGRRVNLSAAFVADLGGRLKLSFIPDGTGDLKTTFGPEDVFHYIYAVLHCPSYRERYSEFLKTDFPRIPLTEDRRLFRRFCRLGAMLTAVHLLETPDVGSFETRFPVAGDCLVQKGYPKFREPGELDPATGKPLEAGRVYLNAGGTHERPKAQFLEGVSPEVWAFRIGGYQVCEKWLKDRQGRPLDFDDLMHYQKIVVALHETIRIMAELDEAIPRWPMP